MGDDFKELAIWGAPGLVGLASFLANKLIELVQEYISERFETLSKRVGALEEGHLERVEILARTAALAESTSEDVNRFAQALDRLVNKPK